MRNLPASASKHSLQVPCHFRSPCGKTPLHAAKLLRLQGLQKLLSDTLRSVARTWHLKGRHARLTRMSDAVLTETAVQRGGSRQI